MFPIDRATSPPTALPARASGSSGGGDAGARLQAGTYNIAAGNSDHRGGLNATTRTLARQVVDEGVDVVALQEVDVGTARALEANGSPDNNLTVLGSLAAVEAGLDASFGADYRYYSLDEEGARVAYDPARYDTAVVEVEAGGQTTSVTVDMAYYAPSSEGAGQALQPGSASDHTVTVYSATITTPDGAVHPYTVVHGTSVGTSGGTMGNSVLIGPGARLQRDADGIPDVQRYDLGANDPDDPDKPGEDGENRTALAVGVEVDGRDATVVSTHLTADRDYDEAGSVQARRTQYETLADIAEGYGDNTLLLGDFNTGGVETVGPLTGENDDENDPGFWSAGPPIDRLYVSDDVDASGREHIEGGNSDHHMLTWNIDLDA